MKLFHILFAGAAALLGVTAANTRPADDPCNEATKESKVRALFLGGVTM